MRRAYRRCGTLSVGPAIPAGSAVRAYPARPAGERQTAPIITSGAVSPASTARQTGG